MVTGDAGQEVEAPVVFFPGIFAVVGAHEADEVGVEVCPNACLRLVFFDIVIPGVGSHVEEGHGQITGKDVVECGDVGGTLDGSVSAQGEDATTGAADISQ